MKEDINIIQANIDNLTSLWQKVAELQDGSFLSRDFSYCYVKNSDWPNRLWFEREVSKSSIIAAKQAISSVPKPLTVSYWDIYGSTSHEILKNAGFQEKSLQIGMSLKLSDHSKKQCRLSLEKVATDGQARTWATLYPKSFGYTISEKIIAASYEHLEFYLASHQGKPIGTAMVYQTGNIVGVHGVGILPEVRRRGFAEEIMEFLLNHAYTLGATYVTLQASAMGKGLYNKLGFEEDFTLKNYIPSSDFPF